MKVLLINGSPRANGNTSIALAAVAKTLEAEGIETITIHIGNNPFVDVSPAAHAIPRKANAPSPMCYMTNCTLSSAKAWMALW